VTPKAIEVARHRLSVAVRVDDHFTGAPVREELGVALSTQEPAIAASSGSLRHPDGTYRFIDLGSGARDVTVTVPDGAGFTWSPTTAIVLPLADPRVPVVIELWPSPKATAPPGALAVRGRLDAPIASPVAPGQEVHMEVVSGFPPRNKRTRIDADREFLFLVVGPTELTSKYRVQVKVTTPGRTIASIDITDGDGTTAFTGNTFDVPPGGEIRAVIKLS
jgi:hypothetical protein